MDAGYAVVTLRSTIEAKPLLRGTSAQKAELIGLTQALQLAAGVCGALYKEKGLINLGKRHKIWKGDP